MIQPVTPLFEPVDEATVQACLDLFKSTEIFSDDEISWLEQTLTRPEKQYDSFGVLEEVLGACHAYMKQRSELAAFEKYKARRVIKSLLHARQISAYKQRSVLVAVPQRIQHPKHGAPNLNGLSPGQHIQAKIHATYGLDYAEARNSLVRAALSDDTITHIFFVDDDILLPRDGLAKLLEISAAHNLPIISGTYTKKAVGLETGVTAIVADPQYVVGQERVPYQHGDMTPIIVSCTGGGFFLIDLEVFRKWPTNEPYFEFLLNEDGKVRVGEDSTFCQKAASLGHRVAVVPGLCALHVDFTQGGNGQNVCTYGPTEIVDPTTRRVRPEYADQYLGFPTDSGFDVKDLVAADVKDFFGKNVGLKERGLI